VIEPPLAPPPPDRVVQPSHTTRIVVTSVLGATAVAGIVGGIVFLSNANNDGDRAASLVSTLPNNACVNVQSSTCAAAQDAAQSKASNMTLSAASFVGGGVLAGAAVASWILLAPRQADTKSVWIVPHVSSTSAGCSIAGQF
jgi:hypothetical protein